MDGEGMAYWTWKPFFEEGSKPLMSPETTTGCPAFDCWKVTVPVTPESPRRTVTACGCWGASK